MCGFCVSRRAVLGGVALLPFAARGERLVEPVLRLAPRPGFAVALTLDACPGGADGRIIDCLIGERVKATLFLTADWIGRNRAALGRLLAHRELFAFENHGAHHIPPVLGEGRVFGLRAAGTMAAVAAEVAGGADAVAAATGVRPGWYRGATGLYTNEALRMIEAGGSRIGGYSLVADQGASLAAAQVQARMTGAVPGDVIIAHVNQPRRPSGAGVVAGILALRARGAEFVHLDARM